MVSDKPIVFVSCGQYAAAEKKLGNDICTLLQEVRPDVEPYFAEDQSTVEGLSNHILKALGDWGYAAALPLRLRLRGRSS